MGRGLRRVSFAVVGASLVAVATAGTGCDALMPEAGDRRPACADVDSDPARAIDFKVDIRPLMDGAVAGTKGCKACHYASTGTREGLNETGLNLETLQTLRAGGRETPPDEIVVPGKPCSSAIVQKLQGTFGEARMPKDGPYWTNEQIQLVIDWIAEGAKGGESE